MSSSKRQPDRVDPARLPIESPVRELRDEGGRLRVTFMRLASVYWLDSTVAGYADIRRALEASVASGAAVQVTYDLATKCITGRG